MSGPDSRVASAYRYATAVALAAIVLVIISGLRLAAYDAVPWLGIGVIALGLAVSAAAPVWAEIDDEIRTLHADGLFIIPALLVLPGSALIIAAALGGLLGYLAIGTRLASIELPGLHPAKAAFAMGNSTLAATGAYLTATAALHWTDGSPAALLFAAGVGGLAADVVSNSVAAGAVARASGTSFIAALVQVGRHDVLLSAVVLVVGLFLAWLALDSTWWPAILMGMMIVLLVTSRVAVNALLHLAQLPTLLRAAEAIHTASTPSDVKEQVCRTALELLRCEDAGFSFDSPRSGELGAVLPGERIRPEWLVVRSRRGTYGTFTDHDRVLLEGLAAVASIALDNTTMREELETRALQDHLTGISNRRGFNQHFSVAAARADRSGERLGLLFIDLDGFKAVNDSFGHDAGDGVLVDVANRLDDITRDGDVIARLGGDEFLLLVHDVKSVKVLTDAVAAGITRELRITVGSPPGALEVTASIGVATYPDDGEDLDGLIKAADAAMYQAKRAGGARAAPVNPT